jgi:hypothetical protein
VVEVITEAWILSFPETRWEGHSNVMPLKAVAVFSSQTRHKFPDQVTIALKKIAVICEIFPVGP